MDSPGNTLDMAAALPTEGTVKCKKTRRKKQEAANAKDNETVEQGAATVTAAVQEGTEKCKKKRKQEVENSKNVMTEQETASVASAVLEGTEKCKKRRKQEVENAKKNGTVDQETASVGATVVEKCKKTRRKQEVENTKENVMVEQETASVAAAVLEGTVECKKRGKQKAVNANENGTMEKEAASVTPAVLEGIAKPKRKKNVKAKESVNMEQEATLYEGIAKPKKKKNAKAKESVTMEQEATTTSLSALEGILKCNKENEKAKERGTVEQEASTTTVFEGIAKSKKKKKNTKAKQSMMMEQEATTTSLSALDETLICKNAEKEKEGGMVEQGTNTSVVSGTEGIPKCNDEEEKVKDKGTAEQESTTIVSASEGIPKCNKKNKKAKESRIAEQEATTTTVLVSASEGTIKCKKNKIQEQHEKSSRVLSGLAVDKIMANNPGNGGANGKGASGDVDVSMDSINADDPNCSKSKDANDKLKCEVQEGNKDCSEKFSPLQGGSEDRNSKRKRDMFSIYSPKGSLIRFQRKKLLILDLNGLLADINMDFRNAHKAHAKVKGKLVFRRPYCDEFLRFCFQNFELGIWSSRKMENVNSVVNILMRDLKQYLLFCWDMSKCTSTGCNVIGNKHKPLVLKELKKLWNKEDPNLPWEQGEFSPSNTLLVDDSPYKALCNPPHTAIFPQPYSYLNQRDDSLGPGGDLRVYLEKLAAADDVQVFVRDNPFGQPCITECDPKWNFYAEIVKKVERDLSLIEEQEKETCLRF